MGFYGFKKKNCMPTKLIENTVAFICTFATMTNISANMEQDSATTDSEDLLCPILTKEGKT